MDKKDTARTAMADMVLGMVFGVIVLMVAWPADTRVLEWHEATAFRMAYHWFFWLQVLAFLLLVTLKGSGINARRRKVIVSSIIITCLALTLFTSVSTAPR